MNKFPLLLKAVLVAVAAFSSASCSKDNPSVDPVPDDVKFMVLSDIHYMHPDLLVSKGKAFEEYNAEECKLLEESGDILDAAAERIREERPAFVVVCGDMSKDGEVKSHEHVAGVFRELEEKTGTKVLVVPGNHDMNNPHSLYYNGDSSYPAESATEAQFAMIYADSGYDLAVERREGSLDYMAYPADRIAFIGVDSNEKNTPEKLAVQGGLSKEQVLWVKHMVRKAHEDGRYVIMAMHHNLVDFYDNAQMIRGANIANARYEDYDNRSLIGDLCSAGIDVVFSGHSHMHSITSARYDSHTVYSVVTSSLVNLPLAYRIGVVDREGKLTLASSDLKNIAVSSGVDLTKEGDRYWRNLSAWYMKEAADKAWGAAEFVLKYLLDFEDKDALLSFLKEHVEGVFYTFLVRTSDGNEHLVTPEANYDAAEKVIEDLLAFFDDKGVSEALDMALKLIAGFGLDEAHTLFSDFFHSAYFNYLGDDPVMPDDAVVIQLTGVFDL